MGKKSNCCCCCVLIIFLILASVAGFWLFMYFQKPEWITKHFDWAPSFMKPKSKTSTGSTIDVNQGNQDHNNGNQDINNGQTDNTGNTDNTGDSNVDGEKPGFFRRKRNSIKSI